MKIEKIICDRCGSAINESHPERIKIEQYNKEVSAFSGKVMRSFYKATNTLQLCEKCRKEMYEFLNLNTEREANE